MELQQRFEELCAHFFEEYELEVTTRDSGKTHISIDGVMRNQAQLPYLWLDITLHDNDLYVKDVHISANRERDQWSAVNNGWYEFIYPRPKRTLYYVLTTGELFAMLPEVIRRAATYADKGWAVRPLDEFSEGRVYAGFSLTYTKQ